MATVTFDGTRIADADSLAPTTPVDGEWTDPAGGAASLETDFFYQGSNSVSDQVKAAEGGIWFTTNTATYDVTSGPKVFLYKVTVTTVGLLNSSRANSAKCEMASGTTEGGGRSSAYYQWYIQEDIPPKGGWMVVPIDANEAAYIDNTIGSPAKASIDGWGFVATMTGTVKSQNVAHDPIDYINSGAGLTITGTGGTFQDFVDFDEGTTTNRYGIVATVRGVIYVNGVLTIGTSTATGFDDSRRSLVFPHGRVAEGFFGVDVGLSNVSQDIDFTACSFKSNGHPTIKTFFDTALDVDGTNEKITVPEGYFRTGDYVYYSDEGGSDTIGLTDATYYWVEADTSTTVKFHSTLNGAMTSGTPVGLTAATAPGENHSLLLDVDTRADHTTTGTSGTSAWTSCIFDGVRVMTLTSACTITGGFLFSCGELSPSTATITGLNIQDQTTAPGVALINGITSLSNITGCNITAGDNGHFAKLTSATTYTSNNTYSGFWNPTTNGWNFDTITGIDAGTDVITTDAAHGFVDGDAVFYNNEGGSDTIGLTHGNMYYVNAPTTSTLTVHVTKAAAVAGSSIIDLSDGSTGETHSLYGAHATLFNDSGGAATINVTTGSSTPSVRNGTSASTTISVSVTITITVVDVDGDPIQDVQTAVYRTSDRYEIMNEDTTALGVATEDYAGSTPVEVEVRCRKASAGSTKYINYSSVQTVDSNGLTLTVTMREDPNNNATS